MCDLRAVPLVRTHRARADVFASLFVFPSAFDLDAAVAVSGVADPPALRV
jgi:hypothetical protein